MERRSFFAAVAGAVGVVGLAQAGAEEAPRQKVVYHVDDVEKVTEALANLRNHIIGTGGPGKADLKVVINGPALKMFHTKGADARVTSAVDMLTQSGVRFEACRNTMRGQEVTLADLLPGFVEIDKGGVVRIAELQMQGYAYIKP